MIRKKLIRRTLIFLTALLALFLFFRWDYYLSQYLFEKVCSDSELIGRHIYERDFIDRKYTRPQSMINGYQKITHDAYYYDGEIEVLKSYIDKHFDYQKHARPVVYSIGPITLNQTSIKHRSDGKLLSKASHAVNQQGWLVRAFSFGYQASYCPSIEVQEGEMLSEIGQAHLNLLRDTLIVR